MQKVEMSIIEDSLTVMIQIKLLKTYDECNVILIFLIVSDSKQIVLLTKNYIIMYIKKT